MTIEEFWDNFTSTERDQFQRTCRRLLKHTFLVRDKDDDNRKAYYFASKNSEAFSEYFRYIGFDIVVDRENGIVMLRNCADAGESGRIQSNRYQLKKAETVVLCCLWTLYADRVRSGSLAKSYLISITDLRFEMEKYGMKELADSRSALADILKLFSRFNLVDVEGKVGDADCRIRLYASLQFALDSEEFRRFAESAQKRLFEDTADGASFASAGDDDMDESLSDDLTEDLAEEE